MLTFAGGDWSIIINSSSLWEEELDSGEEMLSASFGPLVVSSLFSKPKFLKTLDGSVVVCGLTEFSFASGGEGAPVTRPPLAWGFFSQDSDDLLSELVLLAILFLVETEVLKDPGEVKEDEVKTGKGSTAGKEKRNWMNINHDTLLWVVITFSN